VKLALAVVFAAIGCRGDGRAPDRTVPPPGPEASPATTASGTVAGASGAQVADAGALSAGSAGQGPAGPPPGTDKLVAVPPAVAATVKLEPVVRGLKRPVLLTHAPGDARRRLFIVEQRGAVRILENGKLLDKPFFTIGGLSDGNE